MQQQRGLGLAAMDQGIGTGHEPRQRRSVGDRFEQTDMRIAVDRLNRVNRGVVRVAERSDDAGLNGIA